MLWKGVTPIPPARSTAGRSGVRCRTKSPYGPSAWMALPSGIRSMERLKAESRRRVTIARSSSSGAELIEKLRTFPSSSDSGAVIRVRSMYWPALKVMPGAFSNRNSMVRSATSERALSVRLETGQGASVITTHAPFRLLVAGVRFHRLGLRRLRDAFEDLSGLLGRFLARDPCHGQIARQLAL